MGKITSSLTQNEIDFINRQKMFFISSCSNQEVNLSPKGYDSIKVLNSKELVMVDYPGSGNRTARDIQNGGKVTILFTSFNKTPRNLTIFAKGKIIDKSNDIYKQLLSKFELKNIDIIRQIFVFSVLKLENSCGMSTPYYDFKGARDDLQVWAVNKLNKKTLNKYINQHQDPVKLNIY